MRQSSIENMAMFPTRSLGKSTLQLTPIGLGAWAIGGEWRFGWGPRMMRPRSRRFAVRSSAGSTGLIPPQFTALVILKKSSGAHCRTFRAPSGRMCSRSAASCGMRTGTPHTASIRNRFAEKSSRASGGCRRSESNCIRFTGRCGRRARLDTIQASIEEAWTALTKLRDEGKVAFIGVSNFDVAQLKRISQIETPTNLQPPYSMLRPGDRAGDSAVLPGAQHRRDSVLADAVRSTHRHDDAGAHRVAA